MHSSLSKIENIIMLPYNLHLRKVHEIFPIIFQIVLIFSSVQLIYFFKPLSQSKENLRDTLSNE